MATSQQFASTHDSARLNGIRIARISTVPFYVVAQLKNQISYLGRQGASVTVISSDEPERLEFEGIAGVSYHAIDIPRSIAPWRDLMAFIRLLLFFRRRQIQIVHSTTPKAGLLTAVAAWMAGVPVRLHTFTGQPWVTMRGTKRLLARGSDRVIGMLNTRCYTDSPSQRLFLIAEGIIKAEKLVVIGSGSLAGVDTGRFDRSRFTPHECEALKDTLRIPHDAPVLLFVGRITADKGVRELLKAFRQLSATARDAHLVFVGHFDTESGMSSSVSRQDVEGIQNAHVVDYTSTPEAYMAIADILCLPSYREGFGTVVIEAAAMGVPTVGTQIYGLSDAVVHGETGLLVPPRNVEELAVALQKLLSDAPLRAKLGEAANRRAHEKFDAQVFNQLVAAEYLFLLRRAGVIK